MTSQEWRDKIEKHVPIGPIGSFRMIPVYIVDQVLDDFEDLEKGNERLEQKIDDLLEQVKRMALGDSY